MVVATDTAHRHVESQLRRGIGDAPRVRHRRHRRAYAQINVQGPRSRELLQSLTTADLSNEAFPFRTAREIDIGFARVLCVRITYLGELGYELYVPTEQAVHVYDRLVAAGAAFGLRHAGLKALASLRMEKGYRDYGHDIDNTDGPLEAGFGFAIAWDKPGGFVGREAVLARKAAGPLARRLVSVRCSTPNRCCTTPRWCVATACRRLHARRVVRPHPRRRRRAGDGRGPGEAITPAWLAGAAAGPSR